MKIASSLLFLALPVSMVAAYPVLAKGCLRGAAAGALAGHYAHHHAIAGAAAGCVAGHVYYKHKSRMTVRHR